MIKQMSEHQIVKFIQKGGVIAMNPRIKSWWLYPKNFKPITDPQWTPHFIPQQIDARIPSKMLTAGKLVRTETDRKANVVKYRLVPVSHQRCL